MQPCSVALKLSHDEVTVFKLEPCQQLAIQRTLVNEHTAQVDPSNTCPADGGCKYATETKTSPRTLGFALPAVPTASRTHYDHSYNPHKTPWDVVITRANIWFIPRARAHSGCLTISNSFTPPHNPSVMPLLWRRKLNHREFK